mmetsp:Transcript_31158/g.55907  ORF Transcript_31158/g.55907 Transcript_31158/m.55907 type:complete len:90 (+) Transcript_31158:1631-1900(+)
MLPFRIYLTHRSTGATGRSNSSPVFEHSDGPTIWWAKQLSPPFCGLSFSDKSWAFRMFKPMSIWIPLDGLVLVANLQYFCPPLQKTLQQ